MKSQKPRKRKYSIEETYYSKHLTPAEREQINAIIRKSSQFTQGETYGRVSAYIKRKVNYCKDEMPTCCGVDIVGGFSNLMTNEERPLVAKLLALQMYYSRIDDDTNENGTRMNMIATNGLNFSATLENEMAKLKTMWKKVSCFKNSNSGNKVSIWITKK